MNKIYLIILTLSGLYGFSFAQNSRQPLSLEWEEIKNPGQLKILEKKTQKGEQLLRLDIDYNLKQKDFESLHKILNFSRPKELVVHFTDQPTDELLKQIKDLNQ